MHSFFTRIVAQGTSIAQRACNAMRVINRLPYNRTWSCQLDRNCDTIWYDIFTCAQKLTIWSA